MHTVTKEDMGVMSCTICSLLTKQDTQIVSVTAAKACYIQHYSSPE